MCLRVLGYAVIAASHVICVWLGGHLHLSTTHEVHPIFNEVLFPELIIALVSHASQSSLVSLIMSAIILILSCGECILGRMRPMFTMNGIICLTLALLKVNVF